MHRAWAEAGLAPRLLRMDVLPGGWFAVFMQWMQFSDGWVMLSLLLDSWRAQEEAWPGPGPGDGSSGGGSQPAHSGAPSGELCFKMGPGAWPALCDNVTTTLVGVPSPWVVWVGWGGIGVLKQASTQPVVGRP